MKNKIIRCARCNRRRRNDHNWNSEVRGGRIVAYLCPDCQTPDEAEEAEHRFAAAGRAPYAVVDDEDEVIAVRHVDGATE